MQRGKRLTKEQEELRQHGLRLLARIIARRHLALLAHETGLRPSAAAAHPGGSEGDSLPASGAESPIEREDEHGR